jgi:hypothetical protein
MGEDAEHYHEPGLRRRHLADTSSFCGAIGRPLQKE